MKKVPRKSLSLGRSGETNDDQELIPLASDVDFETTMDDNLSPNDRNSTSSTAGIILNEITNGDIMYKEKPSEEPETRCGLWSCRPRLLQKCNNPQCLLLFLSFFSLAQGFVVNGINNVSTTSVERRFQLPSSRVGMISSSYDFSAAILGIFISYLGSGRQKAKWLSCASLTMAVGSFVMALPHFTSGKYEWGQNIGIECENKDTLSGSCQTDEKLQNYLYVLILGQLLHGLGGTTLYTVGVSLIDDSVPTNSSPMYIGIFYAFATIGPALGYIIGGQLLGIYVDFDTVAASEITMTTEDPRWVGAWWIGFMIASGLFITAAIPISLFGAELPTAKHVRETRVSQVHGDDGKMPVAVASGNRKIKDLKRLPAEILQLLKTPPFLFVTLAGTTEGLTVSGLATFIPKFIQNQFSVSAGWAAMLIGFVTVPGAAGGQVFGGYLCKCLKLEVRGSLRVSIICSCLSVVAVSSLWARCSYENIAGVSTLYTNRSIHDHQRTLGQGLTWCIIRLLGTVPGPILFGAAIDSTCILWREKCGTQSSCWIYNNFEMSRNFFIIILSFKLVTSTCFIFAYRLYKPPAGKGVIYSKAEDSVTGSTPNVYTIRYSKCDRATSGYLTNERDEKENIGTSVSVQCDRLLTHL